MCMYLPLVCVPIETKRGHHILFNIPLPCLVFLFVDLLQVNSIAIILACLNNDLLLTSLYGSTEHKHTSLYWLVLFE